MKMTMMNNNNHHLLPLSSSSLTLAWWWWCFCLSSIVVGFFCGVIVVEGQEYPNPIYETNQFNSSVQFRQNLCDIQEIQYFSSTSINGTTTSSFELEDALEGYELRVIIRMNQYFRLDTDGKIDEGYPGLAAVLLDELARRAKFTWRNSYALMDRPMDGKSFTDLLVWSADKYDVSVSWWDHTIDRVSKGISYPEAWYDSSLILVGKKYSYASSSSGGGDDSVFNAWSWLAPFDYDVWGTIVATFVFSGFVYVFLVKVDPYTDKRPGTNKKRAGEAIFDAAMGFAGYFEFEVNTHPARLYQFSLAMFGLLLSSAYTANLASFLVVRNAPPQGPNIESVEDAVRTGSPICVYGGTPPAEQLKTEHPNAIIVEKDQEQATYQGVLDGECTVALAYAGSWLTWERDATINNDCQLEWVGRKFLNTPAGFATMSDSGTRCTSLLRDVINLHMMKMKTDGFIAQAWEQHLDRIETIDCSDTTTPDYSGGRRRILRRSGGAAAAAAAGGSGGGGGAHRLNIINMGGVFIMHGVLSVIAIVSALFHRFIGLQRRRDKERRERNLRRKELLRGSMAAGKKNLKGLLDAGGGGDLEDGTKLQDMTATELNESFKYSLSKVLNENSYFAAWEESLELMNETQNEQMSAMKRMSTRQDEHKEVMEEMNERQNLHMEKFERMHTKQEQQMDQLRKQLDALMGIMAASQTNTTEGRNAKSIQMDGSVFKIDPRDSMRPERPM